MHRGSYDKVASIEMIEAIGEKQFPVFFDAVDRLLVPGGRACVQTILDPRRALAAVPQDAGLDRAPRLPGLPDPVARGSRRRRWRAARG